MSWIFDFFNKPKPKSQLHTLSYPIRAEVSDIKQVIKANSVKVHINNHFANLGKTIKWVQVYDLDFALYDSKLVKEKYAHFPKLPSAYTTSGWVKGSADCDDVSRHFIYWMKRTFPGIPVAELSWHKRATGSKPASAHRFSVVLFSDYKIWIHNTGEEDIKEAYNINFGII